MVAANVIRAKPPVILTDYYLKESDVRHGDILIQGVVAPESWENIGYDSYQRELASARQREKLFKALEQGEPLTPVELGMRGARTKDAANGNLFLLDEVYCIDGRQRIGTLIEWKLAHPEDNSFLSCTVHTNTDFTWEEQRFNKLGTGQRAISPSKIFANMRNQHAGIAAIYGLTNNDKNFALYQRVCWNQNMKREPADLTTGRVVLIVAAHLHSHKVPSRNYTMGSLLPGLDNIIKTFGIQTFKDNVREFFDIVDHSWGLRNLAYKGNVQLGSGFLLALARLFSDHEDFWTADGLRLRVDLAEKNKLRGMRLDQNVQTLAAGGSKERLGLRWHMIQTINHRRRTKLKERPTASVGADIPIVQAKRYNGRTASA